MGYADILEPVRVIEDGDVKIYHAFARFPYSAQDNLNVTNPVPVYEDGREIGVANIYLDKENRVVAYFFVNYASPMRLLNEINEVVYATLYFAINKQIQWVQITRQPLNGFSAKLESPNT